MRRMIGLCVAFVGALPLTWSPGTHASSGRMLPPGVRLEKANEIDHFAEERIRAPLQFGE